MPPAQVVCNVLIHLVNVPAMLATKEQNVMLLVVVTLLVQVVQHAMLPQVNVLAIQDTQEPHVALVLPIIIKQVVERVQVSIHTYL